MKYIIYYFHTSLHHGAEKNSVITEVPLDVYEISRLGLEGIKDKTPSLLQKLEDLYESRGRDNIRKAIP
jgi:hypothetical protein